MEAMTFQGLVSLGKAPAFTTLQCVTTNSKHFKVGESYDVQIDETGRSCLIDEGSKKRLFTASTFVPDNDERGDPGGEPEEGPAPALDIVRNPQHYARLPIQPIEFIIKNDLPGHVSNIVKYSCRAGHKLYPGMDEVQSEIKDLEKAKDWAEKRIRYLKGEPICGAPD